MAGHQEVQDIAQPLLSDRPAVALHDEPCRDWIGDYAVRGLALQRLRNELAGR